MFEDIKRHVTDWNDEAEIAAYLTKILHKDAFDHSGLIYGIGHAVYSKSDPRAEIFQSFVSMLAKEKGYEREYQLYANVERLAPQVIAQERRMYKGVSANVDFYSGFIYQMLGIPEGYVPNFALAIGYGAEQPEPAPRREGTVNWI